MKKTLIWTLIFTLIGAAIPICWNLCTAKHKEITIQEERKIDFPNEGLAIVHNDSVRLDHYSHIVEYSISNTGNTTIVGFGPNSDLLTTDNALRIAADSVIVKLYDNDYHITLDNNHIRFKQLRPNEKISLICITNKVLDTSLIQICDRDIKDADIVYSKYIDKLTTFDKTTPLNRWVAVIGFLTNLLMITTLIVIECWDFAKRKPLRIVGMIIWVIGLLYTMSLPLRWLL